MPTERLNKSYEKTERRRIMSEKPQTKSNEISLTLKEKFMGASAGFIAGMGAGVLLSAVATPIVAIFTGAAIAAGVSYGILREIKNEKRPREVTRIYVPIK